MFSAASPLDMRRSQDQHLTFEGVSELDWRRLIASGPECLLAGNIEASAFDPFRMLAHG